MKLRYVLINSVAIIAVLVFCLVVSLRSPPQAPTVETKIVTVSPPKETPIFTVGVYEVSWHDVTIMDEAKVLDLGLWKPVTGSVKMIYEYDCRIVIGMKEPKVHPRVEGNRVIFKYDDFTAEVLTAEVSNYNLVACVQSNVWTTPSVTLSTLFDDLNSNRDRALELAWTPQRAVEAHKNFEVQVATFYEGLGFEVVWETL